MVLYFVGLGLKDVDDVSLKGLSLINKSEVIYLESYTSKFDTSIKKLEELFNKKVIKADRSMVELGAEKTILKDAKKKKVAFLVVGDPFGATTHADLFLRAKKLNIEVKVIHNASILTAVGITGLELYKFGKVTSIPFENNDIKSPIKALKDNQKLGLHTLFLLDLDMAKDEFLTIGQAADYLIKNKVDKNVKAVACASIGSDAPFIKYGTLKDLRKLKVNQFTQCLIIPGRLHFMEEEMLKLWS